MLTRKEKKMKRKILLFVAIISVLICALAMTVSARHEYTELDENALASLDVKITLTDGTNEFNANVKFTDLFNYSLTVKTADTAYALKLSGVKDTVTIGETTYTLKDSMTGIYIPDGVTHLNNNFLKDYSKLSKACLADSIEYIGDCVFYRCGTFSFVDENGNTDKFLPENLTAIGTTDNWGNVTSHFLSGCTLQNNILVFPEGFTSFAGAYAFNDGYSNNSNLLLVFLGKMTIVDVSSYPTRSGVFLYFAQNNASDAKILAGGNECKTVETRLIDGEWCYAYKDAVTGVDISTTTNNTGKTLTIKIANNDPNSETTLSSSIDGKSWRKVSSIARKFYFCSGEMILSARNGTFGYKVYVSEAIKSNDVHPYDDGGKIAEPTCTIGGGTRYSCGVCGAFIKLENQTEEPLGHDYTEQNLVSSTELTCTQDETKTYECQRCFEQFTILIAEAQGHDYSIVTYPVEATLSSLGIKKTQCANCPEYLEFEYRLDPGDAMAIVILEDGTVLEIKASDLFNYSFNEAAQTALITSIKETTFTIGEKTFSTSNINTIRVPFGFTGIGRYNSAGIEVMDFSLTKDFIIGSETFRDNHTIQKVILGDGAVVNSDAFRCPLSFRSLVIADNANVLFSISTAIFNDIRTDIEIIIGKNATVNFAKENFTSGNVDSRLVNFVIGDGATVIFGKNSFNELTTLQSITIGENCNLTFGENAFISSTALKSLVFPASTTVTFSGNAAFKNCTALTSVSLPASVTAIKNETFSGCIALESVVLMGATSIGENAFNATTDKTLTIFSHANGDLSINSKAFANRANVVLYTMSTNVTSLSTTSYTIYSGIPHSQYEAKLDPSCLANGYDGYATDCPCGNIVSEVTFTIYTSGAEATSGSYGVHTVIPSLGGHTDKIVIVYANGFDKEGSKSVACAVCSEVLSEATVVNPIFVHEGYSYKLNGDVTGIESAFKVDKDALKAYEQASGKKITFGMIIANPTYLGESFFLNGIITASKGAIQVQVDMGDYSIFSCYISGFQKIDPQVNLELVIAGYTYEGDDVSTLKLMQKTYEVGDESPAVSKVTKSDATLHTVNIANVKTPVSFPANIKEFGTTEEQQ